jgi:hypothetical protein
MSNNVNELGSAIQTAMKKIGKQNGTKPPESQDPFDGTLYEYYVSKMGEKFFKDRADAAKDALLKELTPDVKAKIDSIIANTKKNNAGEGAIVGGGQYYALDFTTRKGSTRLDQAALRVKLMMKHKFTAEQVEELMTSCSSQDEPTKIYSVKPVHD